MASLPEKPETLETVPYNEDNSSKLSRKIRESPSVALGVLGMIGMVGYGIFNYRNRGPMKTSVYIMHLRVKAQGMVVGCMAIGVGWSLIKEYIAEGKQKKDTDLDKLH